MVRNSDNARVQPFFTNVNKSNFPTSLTRVSQNGACVHRFDYKRVAKTRIKRVEHINNVEHSHTTLSTTEANRDLKARMNLGYTQKPI